MPLNLDNPATAKALLSLVVAIRVLGLGIYDELALRAIASQANRLTT